MRNNYTIDEYMKKLENQLQSFFESRAYGQVLSSIVSDYVVRIFEQGKDCNGNKIGEYSPLQVNKDGSVGMYINPKVSPRNFPTKGKTGKTKFKNGNAHKTAYFDSYKDFRAKIGRETKFVNLNLFGHEQRDIATSLQKIGDKYIIGTQRPENTDKVNGQIAKYGKDVFLMSKAEKAEYNRLVKIAFIKQLQGK